MRKPKACTICVIIFVLVLELFQALVNYFYTDVNTIIQYYFDGFADANTFQAIMIQNLKWIQISFHIVKILFIFGKIFFMVYNM